MTNKPKFVRHRFAAWTQIDGEILAISPQNNTLHQFNEVASFIWLQMTGEHEVEGMAETVANHFDVSLEQATADVREFMEEIVKKGLVVADQEPDDSK